MKKVAIFSPAAGGSVGHGFIYALKLCSYLKDYNQLVLFTVNDSNKISHFEKTGITVITSNKFIPGKTDKKRFNKYGPLSKLLYGFYRIYY